MSYISAITKGDDVLVWERVDGTRILRSYAAPWYFYYDDENGPYRTMYNTRVSKVTFETRREMRNSIMKFKNRGIRVWESDVPAELRILSENYYEVEPPKLHITFLDIEVDYDPAKGMTVMDMVALDPYAPVNSVALLHYWKKEIVILAVPPEPGWTSERLAKEVAECAPDAPLPKDRTIRFEVCADETELLLRLLQEIQQSDILSGWNSGFFDMPYIAQRVIRVLDNQRTVLRVEEKISDDGRKSLVYTDNPNELIIKNKRLFKFLHKLDFPTHGEPLFRPVPDKETNTLKGNTLDLKGRVHLDYLDLYKKFEPGERPSYKLAAIADLVMVSKDGVPLLPKLEYEGNLARLYRDDFAFFVRYNVRDTEILGGFEDILGYVELANLNCHLSTALFTHVGGTLKLAECALVNYCHHVLKCIVRDGARPTEDRKIDGALVLYPQVGLHENSGSVDINSLYPSDIQAINISPEMIRGQFNEKMYACEQIAIGSSAMLTMIYESTDGTGATDYSETKTAEEWREMFIERRWAVSGYGTVFDQSSLGFIPALLADWYTKRKHYQKLKSEAKDAGNHQMVGYYDRLQYVFKIKLNSLYGALTNLYFRFFDLRLGESTTATGRMIVKHQCRKANEALGGSYNVDFPLYKTIEDALEAKYTPTEAADIALHGPKFKGVHQAEHVIYGDTDSTYFKTNTSNVADAIKRADEVADIINASFPEFMERTFLCSGDFRYKIKAGREIVSDRGIFVEKKRYILHLVNLDGDTVDKMKIMGLDTKKTTLPKVVSAKLNGFIERFLKGDRWEDVELAIVEYKEFLETQPTLYIGLPKGVNKMEEYSLALSRDPQTRLPGHVSAAIHYNEMRKAYKDSESEQIISGMKIKVFYMKNPHGRFKSIAVPADSTSLPPWWNQHCSVDTAAHVLRLVDRPLDNIIKAIGKAVPSRQSLFIDSMLEY